MNLEKIIVHGKQYSQEKENHGTCLGCDLLKKQSGACMVGTPHEFATVCSYCNIIWKEVKS